VNMDNRGMLIQCGTEHCPHVAEFSGGTTNGLSEVMVDRATMKIHLENGQLPRHCKRRLTTFIQLEHWLALK